MELNTVQKLASHIRNNPEGEHKGVAWLACVDSYDECQIDYKVSPHPDINFDKDAFWVESAEDVAEYILNGVG